MKTILKLSFFVFAMILCNNITANAQETAPQKQERLSPEQRAERRSQVLKSKLSLNDEQTAKIKASILSFEGQRTNDRSDIKKNRVDLDQQINSVLTPEQQKKYEDLKAERRAHMKELQKSPPAPEKQ